MILDKNLIFSEGQDIKAISGSATAVASTNTSVVGPADFGYKGMFFIAKVDEEVKAASADGDVTIKLVASDDSTFATGVVTIAEKTFVDFAKTTAVAKDTELVKIVVRDCAGKKYVRAEFAGDGTWAKNAGQSTLKVSAFMALDAETGK